MNRKPRFEVVKLTEIAALLEGGEQGTATPIRTPARILSVTYDQSLSATREMLFASAGFQISSALTVREALTLCEAGSFALIVIGHSMPVKDRQSLMQELRSRCKAPILALHRPGEAPPPGADYTFDSMLSPALLLKTIADILDQENKRSKDRERSRTGPARGGQPERLKSQAIHAKETKKDQSIRSA